MISRMLGEITSKIKDDKWQKASKKLDLSKVSENELFHYS